MAGRIWFAGSSKDRFTGTVPRFKRERGDKIDLSHKVSIVGNPPNGTLVWSGETPAPWGVWYEEGLVSLDVKIDANGDSAADYEVRVGGVDNLTAGDFILPKAQTIQPPVDPPVVPDPVPVPIDPPVVPDPRPVPLPISSVRILIRGQSNSLLLCDRGGIPPLRDGLRAAGIEPTLIYSWNEPNATIHSGTAFLDWIKDGKQEGVRKKIAGLSAAQKAAPFEVVWMQNESDGKDKVFTTEEYEAAVRADAAMMRSAAGRTAAEMPYLFVPVRYPYRARWPQIQAAFERMAADKAFNARISWAAWGSDILMNGGPEAGNNSSHLGDEDAKRVGKNLVPDILASLSGSQVTPAPTPTIAVDLPDARVGRREVVVSTVAVPEFEVAVFEDDAARNWPWRARSGPYKADASGKTKVPVNLEAPGDKVKAFSAALSIDANSGPAIPDPDAPPAPTPPPPVPIKTDGQNWLLHSKMGAGVNQERFTVVEHKDARTPAYYRHYLDVWGVRQVRIFAVMGAEWYKGGWGASDVEPWLAAVDASVQAGVPVTHYDCMDVVGDWLLTHVDGKPTDFAKRTDDFIAMMGGLIAKRGWPTDRVMVGSTNEYGGTRGNAFWKPFRFKWNKTLRDALPAHTLVEGPSVWKDPRSLVDPNFVPWGSEPKQGRFEPYPDENMYIDCHHYLGWDAAGMAGLAQKCLDWSKANNRPVYWGEAGFDSAEGDNAANFGKWVQRIDAQLAHESICRVLPTWWAVTNGSAWPMCPYGWNRLRTEGGLDKKVPAWSRRIDAVIGHPTA
jgi:hypothetical protein